ncbi:MAG: hypothetical protein A4E63_00958 [Syntrophorhabdus sp. PtaU1.Bin050]|nr:MAG: hypothetical protein A4E63_00958 [Syntrophorhabdus sp. PtaU1.Bin050]
MVLTVPDRRMLDGEEGPDLQKAMEILVGVGEAFDSERLIDCSGAHVYTPGLYSYYFKNIEEAKARLEQVKKERLKVKCFSTCSASCPDLLAAPEIEGLSKDFKEMMSVCIDIYREMGIIVTIACAPYLAGIIPQRGEHLEYTESSDWIFANSVQGARSNRGGMSAFFAALTGRIPEYGMHLDENRRANKLFHVSAHIGDIADVGALFFYCGMKADQTWDVPVLTGLEKRTFSLEDFKQACGAFSASGAAAMFHIVGITPEAPMLDTACQGQALTEKIEINEKTLQEAYRLLTSAKEKAVDMVLFGCPHASIKEIGEIAHLLEGKRISDHVRLWVQCLPETRMMAERMGYVERIEKAGGHVLRNTCMVMYEDERKEQSSIPKEVKVLATNSAKTAYYAPAEYGWGVWYGPTESCVRSAVTGKWEG